MARSLDGLIRYLLDRIALCGEHGALPSDFISFVKTYYSLADQQQDIANSHNTTAERQNTAVNVDRPFLERIWKWLTKNPDIQLGCHAGHQHLTLSEVEARNSASREAKKSNDQHKRNSPSSKTYEKAKENDEVLISTPSIRVYTSENRMWHAVAGHGPDPNKIKILDFACLSIIAACGPQGIYQHELVKLSGQDKRSLPARTDRLHEDGYIKKKRTCIQQLHPKRNVHTSHLVLKRFSRDFVSQGEEVVDEEVRRYNVNTESRDQPPTATKALQATDQSDLADKDRRGSRPIPRWTPDRSLSNQIFDLVDQSGTQGMTMRDIRESLLGDYVRKPVDEYVVRLVECWQMSQPLHLRHLSIVKDTVLRGKTNIFIYYTFENYEKLVAKGSGFWEAVVSVADGVTSGTNVAASLSAKPELDGSGFPILDSNLFEGPNNDATLSECVNALKVERLHIAGQDPVLKKRADGTYDIRYRTPQGALSSRNANHVSKEPHLESAISKHQLVDINKSSSSSKTSVMGQIADEVTSPRPRKQKSFLVRSKGRPRLYSNTDTPAGVEKTDSLFKKKVRSQVMAERYARKKIEKEISLRIEEGGNTFLVTHEVLAEVEALRKEAGQSPIPEFSREMILHSFAGGLEPVAPETISGRPHKRAPYWPSMAAHTILMPNSPEKTLMSSQCPSNQANDDALLGSRKRRLPAHLRDPEKEAESPPPKKQRRRPTPTTQTAAVLRLASVAAHSWPHISRPPASRLEAPKEKINLNLDYSQKPKDPSALILKRKQPHEPCFRYLPSIAAHSGAFLPALLQPKATPNKRKKARRETLVQDALPLILENHAAGLQAPLAPPKQTESVGASPPLSRSPEPEGLYPGWRKFMSKYYEQALRDITRSHEGMFIGETKPRRKRVGEPADFRPRNFKIIIFKCARLKNLGWFKTYLEVPKRKQSFVTSRKSPNKTASYPSLSSDGKGPPDIPVAGTPNKTQVPEYQLVKETHAPLSGLLGPSGESSSSPQPSIVSAAHSTITGIHPLQSPVHSLINSRCPQSDSPQRSSNATIGGTYPSLRFLPPQAWPHTGSARRERVESEESGRDIPTANSFEPIFSWRRGFPVHMTQSSNAMRTQTVTLGVEVGLSPISQGPDQIITQDTSNPAFKGPYVNIDKEASLKTETEIARTEESLALVFDEATSVTGPALHRIKERSSSSIEHESPSVNENQATIASTLGHPTADEIRLVQDLAQNSNATHSPIASIADRATSEDKYRTNSTREIVDQAPRSSSHAVLESQREQEIVQTSTSSKASAMQADRDEEDDPQARRVLGFPADQLHDDAASGTREDNVDARAPISGNPPTNTMISGRESFERITRKGGSAAKLRENVVMDILERCEGVFPGYKEIAKPFAAEWAKRGQTGTTEDTTIRNAIESLRKQGRLHSLRFVFHSKQGKPIQRVMYTLPDIHPFDARVKDLQRNIMAHYPRNYLPEALMSREEAADTNGQPSGSQSVTKGKPELSKKIMQGKNMAAQATLAAMKAQEQMEPEQTTASEVQLEDGISDQSIEMIPGPIARVPIVPYFSPSYLKRLTAIKRSRGGKVQQMAKIRKSSKSVLGKPSLPPPTDDQSNNSSDLMWLPAEYAFSEFNFEEDRPTAVEPAIDQDTHRLHARYGIRLNTLQTTKRARARVPKDPLMQALFPSPYCSPYAAEPNLEKLEPEEIHEPPKKRQKQILPAPDKFRGELSNSPSPPAERSAVLPPQELIQTSTATTPPPAEQRHNPQPRQKEHLVGYMDAIHYFHQNTGTFSVAFSGLGPPRQINKKVGTGSKPYALGPRRFHPDFPAPRGPRKLLPKRAQDAEDTEFEQENHALLQWELGNPAFYDAVFEDLPFVNHTFRHAHVTAETVEAELDSMKEVLVSSQNGRFIHRKFPKEKEIRPKIGKSVFNAGDKDMSPAIAEALQRIARRAPHKRRRLTTLTNERNQHEISEATLEDVDSRPPKVRRIRGPRDAKSLGEIGEKRLLTAVTIIRIVTGGLERRIDWVLVAKAYGQGVDQTFLNSRWNYVLQKHKLMLPTMETDFQDLFADAYENDFIPAMDFDNLFEYDWNWLTNWTMAQLNTRRNLQPDLPINRAEFDESYELKDTSSIDISDYYGINGPHGTVESRANLINSKAFVYSTTDDHEGLLLKDQDDMSIVKNWVRANVIASEDGYDPFAARAKMARYPIEVVEDALKLLIVDRVLKQENKGRLIPGRNYDVSEYFISRLKKNILPEHFQRAVTFKQHLDEEFELKGSAPYLRTAGDGDIIVITNLAAHGRIKIVPLDIPLNSRGQIEDSNYVSRLMDKGRLNFQIQLQPTPKYVTGYPLFPLPEPPSEHLEDPMAKIPLWYDIQGGFVPIMWEMSLAAVMAVLAVRNGVGAKEIEMAVRPALEEWELESILRWMVRAKAAERVGDGYQLTEWCWMALGEKVDKGKGKEVVYVSDDE